MTDFIHKVSNVSEYNPFTTVVHMDESKDIAAGVMDRWLYVEGNGFIDQILIDSTVNDYLIEIKIDDKILWNSPKAQSWFAARNTELAYVSAYTSAGTYKLSFQDIYFKESFHIQYKMVTAGTFNTILCRYTVREEAIKK